MTWDDVDKWRETQLERLPPKHCQGKGESADRARTRRAAERIELGWHQLGQRLRDPPGETCGTCDKFVVTQPGAHPFFKCRAYGLTRSAASDIRKSWPACIAWVDAKPKPEVQTSARSGDWQQPKDIRLPAESSPAAEFWPPKGER